MTFGLNMLFRETFHLATKHVVRWFPGHMAKSLKQMQQRLKAVDCVIEVHDARIPFSGRNAEFQHSITGGGVKPHLLVLNKKDLGDTRDERRIKKQLMERHGIRNVLFTNCKDQQCSGVNRILPLAVESIVNSERYNRAGEKDFSVMVIGVPNVGKSSLLNVLRNRNLRKKSAAQVGAEAGITRSVMERIKICDNPRTYMIDTPGILEPSIKDDEMGLKLALIGCLPDHLVGEDLIADYLLYWLNHQRRFDYVHYMGLKEPSDRISEVLIACANRLGVQKKVKKCDGQTVLIPDVLLAARRFIRHFRKGNFGPVNLDTDFTIHNRSPCNRVEFLQT